MIMEEKQVTREDEIREENKKISEIINRLFEEEKESKN